MTYALYINTPIYADIDLISELAALTGKTARELSDVLNFGGQLSYPVSNEQAEQLAQQLDLLGIETEIKTVVSVSHEAPQVPRPASTQTVNRSTPKKPFNPLLIVIPIAVTTLLWFLPMLNKPNNPAAGMLAAEQPVQLESDTRPWLYNDYLITPLAKYELQARVLASRRYRFSRSAELSPLDAALGWGPMSDSIVLNKLEISQRGRWYFVRWSNPPIPPKTIMDNSANTHLIPANNHIAKKIKRLSKHDVVHLKGYLVNLSATDGFYWNSSVSRLDRGDGSCELFWVEDITVLP